MVSWKALPALISAALLERQHEAGGVGQAAVMGGDDDRHVLLVVQMLDEPITSDPVSSSRFRSARPREEDRVADDRPRERHALTLTAESVPASAVRSPQARPPRGSHAPSRGRPVAAARKENGVSTFSSAVSLLRRLNAWRRSRPSRSCSRTGSAFIARRLRPSTSISPAVGRRGRRSGSGGWSSRFRSYR